MADKEIDDLTVAAALDGDEEVHALQGANSRRLKLPGTWRLHDTWDHAVDGDSATVDFTGLAGAQDIMLIARLVTKSVSGLLAQRVSTDNGVSFYDQAGDYILLAEAGTETNADSGGALHGTAATAARSGVGLIHGANVNGGIKYLNVPQRGEGNRDFLFVASTAPINAARIYPGNGGNLTGGKIYCLVRGKAAT
ncbi:MAG TPA: hypothetical protein VGA50_04680 [Kiloniellales bacterium]